MDTCIKYGQVCTIPTDDGSCILYDTSTRSSGSGDPVVLTTRSCLGKLFSDFVNTDV